MQQSFSLVSGQRRTERKAAGVTPRPRGGATGARGVDDGDGRPCLLVKCGRTGGDSSPRGKREVFRGYDCEVNGLLALVMRHGGVEITQLATERIAAGVTPRLRGGATGARGVVAVVRPVLVLKKSCGKGGDLPRKRARGEVTSRQARAVGRVAAVVP